MATVPAEVHGPSDAELIESVRAGQVNAYGALYERHVGAAHNLARQLSRSQAEADDLVSEAFARVLDTLRAGRGPDSAFRAYLLTALRHVAYDKTRRDRRLELAEDVTEVKGIDTEKVSEPFTDTAVAGLERSLAAKAFARLPERWQAVLWHTEIEGQNPAEVAPLLGLTANGVSALAYRAREGLRQAYLQVHLAETTAERCRATVDKLGAWTRGGLSKRERVQVEAHLDECERCTALAAELADVNGGLRLIVAPLVLGGGAVAGYLAATHAAAAKAAVAAGTVAGLHAGAAAGGAAAGGAGSGGGAAGAANAASSLPRQLVGVGASVAVLAAAIALALTGGRGQQIPVAQAAPPPPTHSAPAAPPPAPNPAPNPPPAAPPPSPNPPSPAVPPSPASPAPPPAPGQPDVTASGPAETITLTPGQGAQDVPITVRNNGSGPSAPVSSTLNLPPGVTALGQGAHFGTAGPLSLEAPQSAPAEQSAPAAQSAPAGGTQVDCPGGTGTVTCTSPTGLQPGQSVVLMYRLEAAEGSQGGLITGTVNAGTGIRVTVSVRVQVPPPAAVDALSLAVHARTNWWWWASWWNGRPVLDVTATNTGTSTKPVTLTFTQPGLLVAGGRTATCAADDTGTSCASNGPLKPGQSVHLSVRLAALRPSLLPPGGDAVTVTGMLGSATRSAAVPLPTWPYPLPWPVPGPPGPVGPTTTTTPGSTPPVTGSTAPSTTSPGPTTTTTPGAPPSSTPPGSTGPVTPGPTTTTTKPPVPTTMPKPPSPPKPPAPPSSTEPPPPPSPTCPGLHIGPICLPLLGSL